jgi:hypothetical protein
MAQSVATILSALKSLYKSTSVALGLDSNPNNWAPVDTRQLILGVVAQQSNNQQVLFDAHIKEVEGLILSAPPQTEEWFKDKMINLFEYDATAVPIVKLDTTTFAPKYTSPNANFRVVKYCSVVTGVFGTVLIKIAGETSGVPSILDSSVVSAAQSFINIISFSGITYTVVSRESDKLYVEADVYYKGVYSAVIQANVELAISNFLKSIPFDGTVEMGDLLASIRKVDGVKRAVLKNVKARQDSVVFALATIMIDESDWVLDVWDTYAGYIIPETTTGHTLADSITYIPE